MTEEQFKTLLGAVSEITSALERIGEELEWMREAQDQAFRPVGNEQRALRIWGSVDTST